jgi:hypothetical protein
LTNVQDWQTNSVMKLKSLADAMDMLSALFSIGAVVFVLINMDSIDTGPQFMQIGLASLMLAIIPYCLAGAFHRLASRQD